MGASGKPGVCPLGKGQEEAVRGFQGGRKTRIQEIGF